MDNSYSIKNYYSKLFFFYCILIFKIYHSFFDLLLDYYFSLIYCSSKFILIIKDDRNSLIMPTVMDNFRLSSFRAPILYKNPSNNKKKEITGFTISESYFKYNIVIPFMNIFSSINIY